MRSSTFILTLATFAVAPGVIAQTPAERQVVADIERFADSLIKSVPVAGVSIVVVRGSETLLSKGYGVADVRTGRRMTDSTASRIGSITKVFTAVAIMKLVDRGQVDLDTPIGTYLPGLSIPPVTIRQALNHTSGLPDSEGSAMQQWMTDRKPITTEFILGILATQPARTAGAAWAYNNTGFHLLGLVIEKVSGTSYEEFIQREISRPLGLNSTWMHPNRPAGAVETENYYLRDGRFVRDSLWDLPGIWSAGGMLSTATDLSWFVRALASGDITSKPALEKMITPTVLPSGARADYGLGIRLGAIGNHPKLGHTGSARSTRAAAAHYPLDSLTVVVLMNTEQDGIPISAIEIEGRIARMALGISTNRRTDLRLTSDSAAEYTGTYSDGAVQNLIAEKDGVLHYSRVGSTSPPVPLLYQGGETWADPEYAEFFFVFQRQGPKVVGLARYDNGWFVGVRARQ